MANRIFSQVQALSRGLKLIAGSFAPAGAGAPTDQNGSGFSVTRTGAGTFQVKLTDTWPKLNSGKASLQLHTADKLAAQLGDVDLVAKTAVIRVVDSSTGVATDVAANANNRIHFEFWFKNSAA
jgi:hypothetical protein